MKLTLKFNAKKSCWFKVGWHFAENIGNLQLDHCEVAWSNKIKYLGIFVVSDKCFNLDFLWITHKFYAAANAIFSHTKYVHELPRLFIWIIYLTNSDLWGWWIDYVTCHSYLSKLNVCWNNVYRNIFGMHKWESVKCVQLCCDKLDLIRIVHKRNFSFFKSLFCTCNPIVDECFSLLQRTTTLQNFCNVYDVTIDNDWLHVNVWHCDRFCSLCSSY